MVPLFLLLLLQLTLASPAKLWPGYLEAVSLIEGIELPEQVSVKNNHINSNVKKTIFVAGATGETGKRIVKQLLARGFAVKAGVRDINKAKTIFPPGNPDLQLVRADLTEGSAKLAEAIGSDSEAVICAAGYHPGSDVTLAWKVDNLGTVNLVEATRQLGINRFILISSMLVNGAAIGRIISEHELDAGYLEFVVYLISKLQAERHIRKTDINYTIIRPAVLINEPPTGNLVMVKEDTIEEGTISRDLVAEVAVEALLCSEASYKVVEIVSSVDAPKRMYKDLFGSIKRR